MFICIWASLESLEWRPSQPSRVSSRCRDPFQSLGEVKTAINIFFIFFRKIPKIFTCLYPTWHPLGLWKDLGNPPVWVLVALTCPESQGGKEVIGIELHFYFWFYEIFDHAQLVIPFDPRCHETLEWWPSQPSRASSRCRDPLQSLGEV